LAENKNRSLVKRAKCMLFEAELKKSLWAEAVPCAAYMGELQKKCRYTMEKVKA
jgi:hypothetical protein